MTTLTDPARELADIAERLAAPSGAAGQEVLAERFGVAVWSTEFVKIIACILERADLVGAVIRGSSLDEDHQNNALADLAGFKAGFSGASFNNAWNSVGMLAMKDHGRVLQYLSQTVRPVVSYPKLTADEVLEFIGLIDSYLAEVRASDEGPAFVRQSIIDGLTSFKFQLEMIGWMGSGYALAGFREVMFLYESTKWNFGDGNPDAEAFLKGFLTIITKFKTKVDEAKGWASAGGAVWKTYNAISGAALPLLATSRLLGHG